jgi:hypothetical protein
MEPISRPRRNLRCVGSCPVIRLFHVAALGAAVMLTPLVTACASISITQPNKTWATLPASELASMTRNLESQVIGLPTPRLRGSLTLEETLAQRRSVREFSDTALTLEEIGQVLWAAQGITDSAGLRTAPSAGALYPLELYIVTREGVYRYEPRAHRLISQVQRDIRSELYAVALRQAAVLDAPAVVVITAVYARTAQKYGQERSLRYVRLEGGG